MTGRDDVDDVEAFRAQLAELLRAAEEAGVSTDAVAGLLTAHLAGIRGTVRLPLSMPPARAREFRSRAADNVGETMTVELQVTDDVLEDLDLQLRVFGGDPVDGDTADADPSGE